MHQAVEHVVLLGQFAGQPLDLLLELDIANKHGRIANQRPHLLPPLLIANDVHHFRPRLGQHPANMPRHALPIGHAHHEDALAGKL